jgi:hypothetical protein
MGMARAEWLIIGVVGTRSRDDWGSQELVFNKLKELWVKNKTIICSGGCGKGADRFARNIAYVHQLPYLEFPAEWHRKGRTAGFARNTDIAEWSDVLVACVNKERTGGTEDTIKKFCALGKEQSLHLV